LLDHFLCTKTTEKSLRRTSTTLRIVLYPHLLPSLIEFITSKHSEAIHIFVKYTSCKGQGLPTSYSSLSRCRIRNTRSSKSCAPFEDSIFPRRCIGENSPLDETSTQNRPTLKLFQNLTLFSRAYQNGATLNSVAPSRWCYPPANVACKDPPICGPGVAPLTRASHHRG
jgi:hypothetical protein